MSVFAVSDWLNAADLIITILVLCYAIRQFGRLRKTHSIEIALSLDKEITETEKRLLGFIKLYSLIQYSDKSEEQKRLEREHLREEYKYLAQVYFDLLDKLCLALLEGYIEGNSWHQEYKPIIARTIKEIKIIKGEEVEIEIKHKNIYKYAKKNDLFKT